MKIFCSKCLQVYEIDRHGRYQCQCGEIIEISAKKFAEKNSVTQNIPVDSKTETKTAKVQIESDVKKEKNDISASSKHAVDETMTIRPSGYRLAMVHIFWSFMLGVVSVGPVIGAFHTGTRAGIIAVPVVIFLIIVLNFILWCFFSGVEYRIDKYEISASRGVASSIKIIIPYKHVDCVSIKSFRAGKYGTVLVSSPSGIVRLWAVNDPEKIAQIILRKTRHFN